MRIQCFGATDRRLFVAYRRNIVLRVAGDDAAAAPSATVEIDRHSPLRHSVTPVRQWPTPRHHDVPTLRGLASLPAQRSSPVLPRDAPASYAGKQNQPTVRRTHASHTCTRVAAHASAAGREASVTRSKQVNRASRPARSHIE